MTKQKDNDVLGGFHIRKEITLGHIFTTLSVVVAVLLWGNVIERRISNLELSQQYVDARIAASERRNESTLQEIKAYLQRIDDKLDRKADKVK
jgi:hypothetical protein